MNPISLESCGKLCQRSSCANKAINLSINKATQPPKQYRIQQTHLPHSSQREGKPLCDSMFQHFTFASFRLTCSSTDSFFITENYRNSVRWTECRMAIHRRNAFFFAVLFRLSKVRIMGCQKVGGVGVIIGTTFRSYLSHSWLSQLVDERPTAVEVYSTTTEQLLIA